MQSSSAARFKGYCRGMGIGGWLTNYKRFNVLPQEWRMPITIGDMEHFETYISRDDVQRIASFGMDHIRLAFDQIVLEEAENPGVFRENILELIDRFIFWCEEAGINVVLNLHKAIGNYCDINEDKTLLESPELCQRFIHFWMTLEKRWNHKPNLVFELLNELHNVPADGWNKLAGETIDAIRQLNPNRKIIIGGPCWNHPAHLHELKDFADSNVIYTFHCYAPMEFTHQRGVLMPAQLYYNRAMAYPGDIQPYREFHQLVYQNPNAYSDLKEMNKDYLRICLQPAFDFVEKNPDKILWCGEFGTIRHCKIQYRENWMRDVISLLKAHGIPYCVWNYLSTPNDGNRFSLVDDDHRNILSPELLKIIQGNVD